MSSVLDTQDLVLSIDDIDQDLPTILETLRHKHPEIFSWIPEPDRSFDMSWSSHGTSNSPLLIPELNIDHRRPPRSSPSPVVHGARTEVRPFIEDKTLASMIPSRLLDLAAKEQYWRESMDHLKMPDLADEGFEMLNLARYHDGDEVAFHDIKGHEDNFTLESSGFHFARCTTPVGNWSDYSIQKVYLPQLAEWLRGYLRHPSSATIFPYAYTIRDCNRGEPFVPAPSHCGDPDTMCSGTTCWQEDDISNAGDDDREMDIEDSPLARWLSEGPYEEHFHAIRGDLMAGDGSCRSSEPFIRIHGDGGPGTPRSRLRLYYPVEHKPLHTNQRVRMISVWRLLPPHHLHGAPLAVCDIRTTASASLEQNGHVYPGFSDEAPVRRWFYKSGMGPEDAVVFQLHDNNHTTQQPMTTCPYPTSTLPTSLANSPRQASIEVRFFVIDG